MRNFSEKNSEKIGLQFTFSYIQLILTSSDRDKYKLCISCIICLNGTHSLEAMGSLVKKPLITGPYL